MKNHVDTVIFHTDICVEDATNIVYRSRKFDISDAFLERMRSRKEDSYG